MASMTQGMVAQPVRLSRSYKVTWGVAALGSSLINGVFQGLRLKFFQDILGLSAAWIGVAMLIYGIWNAINDPLFGYITDNTRSKLGRRIPYMRYTAPFLALTFILVWLAPPQASQTVKFLWMLVSFLLYDTCYTMIGLVYSALLPEVSESDAERNSLQISSSLFGLLGTLLGFIIPDLFRPKSGDASLLPLQIAMTGVALVSMVLIIITTLKVKERPEFTKVDKPISVKEAIKFTLTSKPFLILAAANFMSILMQSLVLSSLFYLADYVLKINMMIVLACVFIPLIIGVTLTGLIRRYLGVVKTQQLLLVIAGVGLCLLVVAPNSLVLVCLAVAGFGLSGPQTLTNVLFAQVADEDELRSGVRREGAFFGVNALITKPADSVALTVASFILAAAHFITQEQNGGLPFLNQPESALFGIRAIIGLIPGLAMLLGALILQWYPLRGKYLQQVQQKVLDLHARKSAELRTSEAGPAPVEPRLAGQPG